MGYVEETGVAQTLRDARVLTIYEGTTAIQANDLLRRKLALDGGASFQALLENAAAELTASSCSPSLARLAESVVKALRSLTAAAEALRARFMQQPLDALALAVPLLMMCGDVLGAWLLVRSAQLLEADAAAGDDFAAAKLQKARFYVEHALPPAIARAAIIHANAGAAVVEADVRLMEIPPQ
jgi:hypothetical protein